MAQQSEACGQYLSPVPSRLPAGREHLLFYARIKNLSGRALRRAVDDGLRSVNLFTAGDDLVGGYRWVGRVALWSCRVVCTVVGAGWDALCTGGVGRRGQVIVMWD